MVWDANHKKNIRQRSSSKPPQGSLGRFGNQPGKSITTPPASGQPLPDSSSLFGSQPHKSIKPKDSVFPLAGTALNSGMRSLGPLGKLAVDTFKSFAGSTSNSQEPSSHFGQQRDKDVDPKTKSAVVSFGVFVPQELESHDLEEFKFMIDVNVIGTFHLIKAALPGMKKRTGGGPASIAIMSSQAGQVGISGYTAYSASKFALRGMAEALQQEVIADNIHVTLIFPPDTETPGFAEENKRRPQLTSIIAGSSGSMKADEVARKALNGIKSGNFIVPCNFEGIMLSISTAGLSPQRSFLMAFVEVVAAGTLRFAALFFQWNWYSSIEKWHTQKR